MTTSTVSEAMDFTLSRYNSDWKQADETCIKKDHVTYHKVEEILQLCSGVYIFAEEPTAATEDVTVKKICFKQSAVHQPEEPCSKPLSCSETEER